MWDFYGGVTEPRWHRGRFDASLDTDALNLAVAAELRYARPYALERVTQRRFDDARVSAGLPDSA
jgi:hypothetical protein